MHLAATLFITTLFMFLDFFIQNPGAQTRDLSLDDEPPDPRTIKRSKRTVSNRFVDPESMTAAATLGVLTIHLGKKGHST